MLGGAGVVAAQNTGSLSVREADATLIASGDRFVLRLPLQTGGRTGRLTVAADLLDTQGVTRSHASAPCRLIPAATTCEVELPPATKNLNHLDDNDPELPLYRVGYSVTLEGQPTISGIMPLDRIAPGLFELHVAAPRSIRPGAHYIARVRAIHPHSRLPRANLALEATVTASYAGDKDDAVIDRVPVVTDADGFASIPFAVPDDKDVESIDLDVQGAFANLKPGTALTLRVPVNERFELTTDKPLYQPGQTVHTRMLLLDRNAHAAAGKTVRVDVRDPNQTLVYRATAATSAYGIATLDWEVPARMRLGEYTLNASLPDDEENSRSASARVRVSRYDLPTFVVNAKPDRTFYLPRSNAVVDVRAEYLFGRPVLHGHVRVVREDDRTWNFAQQRFDSKEGRAVSGELDKDGSFKAHIDLREDEKNEEDQPSNRTEDIRMAAYVTDASTGRTEQRRFDLRIARQALQVYVIDTPQAVGLGQKRYVSVTSADGTPVECDLTISLLPQETDTEKFAKLAARAGVLERVHTDAHGLARISLPVYAELMRRRPAPTKAAASVSEDETPALLISARDGAGNVGSIAHPVQEPSELLRMATDRTIYRAGEAIAITIDSAEEALPLTVQVVRSTQRGNVLLETRTVALSQGHAALTIPTDARYSGAVFVNAIALGALEDKGQRVYQDWQTSVASRAVLFPRDNDLHVGITMSAATYRPGTDASAAITVRGPQDVDGDETAPAASALGIVAVDRAVGERDRSDREFGAAGQTFFFNNWNGDGAAAGGFTTASLQQLDMNKPLPEGAQLAAEILLANARPEVDTADDTAGDLAGVFRVLLEKQLDSTRKALTKYLAGHTELPVDARGLATLLAGYEVDFSALRDPWGRPFTLVAHPDNFGQTRLALVTDGPDKLHGTADDFEIELASWRWANSYAKQLAHAVDAYHQRTGAYIRTLADLRAEMQAEGMAFDQWRDPWGQPFLFHFSIAGTHFAVEFLTTGDPNAKPRYAWQRGPFSLGTETIDYTTEMRRRVDDALIAYTDKHSFPRSDAQLHAALHEIDGLSDPWHHPLYAAFRSRSSFADHAHTEAHAAAPGAVTEVRTTIVPVTEISDIIDLWSAGPDGKRRTRDDFVFASFSVIRSQQSAQDASPRHLARGTVHNGQVGDIGGVVTDQSGADIAGVTVTATNLISGAEFETQSEKDGRYLLGLLPVGNYKLRFHAAGFNDMVYDRVDVELKGTVTVIATLNVGSANEMVTVTASTVTVGTSSASVATVVSQGSVQNLPVDGNVVALAALLPGAPPRGGGGQPTATPRLREYFPETLLWRPEVITAADGTATVRFPVADNITTWQLSAAASTMEGNTGAGTAAFATFQPFFAASDPPSILTAGDSIALPVTLRNYLDHAVSVESSIAPAPWFRLDGPATRTTTVDSGQSASPVFRFTAVASVADAKQEFNATATDTGDRIARSVSVHPDGFESAVTASAVLAPGANTLNITLPADMLAGSSDATLKVYPNLGAHLRDALTAMAAYPDGCAEQIMSIAWPSLLIQRYTANLPRRNEANLPQYNDTLRQKTHAYLEKAYQNLLGNQLASGAFGYWTRDSYADIALTAYAVEFLHAASEFIAVDPKVVSNAVAWLAKEQEKDGQWLTVDWQHKKRPEEKRGNAMLTASVAAMIAGAPEAESLMRKALAATQSFSAEFDEPYTLASYALASLALGDTARSGPAIARLRSLALSEDGGAYWSLETNTPFYGWGRAGRVESSAQVLRALLAAGAAASDDLVARGMLFLDRQQDRQSLWYSTQATARVLDVLAAIALRTPATVVGDAPGSLTVNVDGHSATTVALPPATVDGGPILIPLGVPLGAALASGEHRVSLALPPSAQAATALVVANFYRPWPIAAASAVANHEQLRMSVAFNTRRPQPRQPVTVNAHIERIGFRGYGMMLAEIGLPPGADVDRASLESALGSQLNHYELLPDCVLLYVSPRAGGLDVRFRFTLRYGIDALTAPSRLYDYYNPDVHVDLAPTRFSSR